MIPIILGSFWMWALIIERIICFKSMEKDDVTLDQVADMVGENKLPGTLQGLYSVILTNFFKQRTDNRKLDHRKLDHGILELCVMRERPRIRKSIAGIAVLAAVSPLFGLLGTVTGMMTTFDVMAVFGAGNAKAMAGGISEALITTQSGLLVAVPGFFMSGLLSRRAVRMENRLDELVMTVKRSL